MRHAISIHHTGVGMKSASRTPRRSVRILGWIVIAIVIVAVIEIYIGLYYALTTGRYIGAHQRLLDDSNLFVAAINEDSGCRYVDSLYPHPYLAHVHRQNTRCPNLWVNRIGLFGDELPLERNPERFVVLLTGGSVAAQLAQITRGAPRFLQEELNRCYKPPHGDGFEVLNGADGAWKQPQQAIFMLVYGEIADAVVTLDGFNEHYNLEHRRLEFPSSNFVTTNPLVSNTYGRIAAVWIVNELRRSVANSPVLSHSFIVYATFSILQKRLARYYGKAPNQRFFDSMFALPQEWSKDQKFEYNIIQYQKYIRAIDAIAARYKMRAIFFLQPVPAISKTLTEEEKKAVQSDLFSYRDLYRRAVDRLLEGSREGIEIHSLLDVFENERGTIYGDPIHFAADATGDSRGNRLVAAAIARRLGEAWKMERICPLL
jgi:hypothetical protein